ncbi:MAG: methyl-accepting chemotaxis protein [Oscillospiraceae bacterium]|nr:methyl-accepting chemotaxis protein [Oscillospiraceae bacterium]
MKNLKIAQKLIVSFLIIAVLAAVVGIVGIVSARSLSTSGNLLNTRANTGILTGDLLASAYHQRATITAISLYTATFNPDMVEQQKTSLQHYISDGSALFNKINDLITTTEARKLFDTISSRRQVYSGGIDTFLKDIAHAATLESDMDVGRGNGMESAAEKSLEDFKAGMDDYLNAISALSDFMEEATDTQAAEMNTLATFVLILLIVILLAAVVAAIFLAVYISGLIGKPINLMQRFIVQVGRTGNLNFSDSDKAALQKEAEGKDEIGQSLGAFSEMLTQFIYYGDMLNTIAGQDLTANIKVLGDQDTIGNALAEMLNDLNEMFAEINSATEKVADEAKQISDSSQTMAQGATEQAASVEELSSSIAEVAGTISSAAQSASNAATLSDSIRDKALQGAGQMGQMMDAVREIGEASANISKVISVIDNIAFQTNILALNAAVEAARAGSAGKGFAVVAEEVRSLASKSAEAAKETSGLIENSTQKAELGIRIANETNASLQEIVEGIAQTSSIVNEIAESSQSEAEAIRQINLGVDQVAQVVQQNSAISEESAATASELSSQASVLEGLVGEFKLTGNQNKRISTASPKKLKPAPKATAGGSSPISTDDSFGKY